MGTYALGGFRTDLVISGKVAPPGTPNLDAALWHANAHVAIQISDELHELGADLEVDVQEAPIFPGIRIDYRDMAHNTGAAVGQVGEAIRREFQKHDLQMPKHLQEIITGCIFGRNADEVLAYLMRWVFIGDTRGDDE